MAGGWDAQAACRGLNPRLFFPGPVSNASIAQAERARAVCDRCPVRALCLDDALAMEEGDKAADRIGIRGGLDGRERYALQVGHRPPRRPLPIPDDGREHGERRTYRKGCKCYACCAADTSKEPRQRPELAPCGTHAAYRRHLRHGQEIDPLCAANRWSRKGTQQLESVPAPTAADQAADWHARERSAA